MSRTIIYVDVYILLDFTISYRNASVLFQSECECLHKSVNSVVVLVKKLIPIYRVVPQTKRGNCVKDGLSLKIIFFTNSSVFNSHTILMKLCPCGRYRQLNSVLYPNNHIHVLKSSKIIFNWLILKYVLVLVGNLKVCNPRLCCFSINTQHKFIH